MTRLKALSVLLTVLAMSAIGASAAQAGFYEVENEVYPTSFSGEQISGKVTNEAFEKHVFKTHAGLVQCSVAKFSGVITSKNSAQTVTPVYEKCLLAGVGAEVALNGCDYIFTAGETEEASPDKVLNAVHVICPSGKKIEVKSANCVVSVPGAVTPKEAGAKNQELNFVTAENETGAVPMAIIAYIDVSSINYSTNGKCPNDGGVAGSYTDGTYKGVATLKASRGITVT